MSYRNVIPKGYQVFEDRVEVTGVSFFRAHILSFAKSKSKWLALEQDTDTVSGNKLIKIFGCTKWLFITKRKLIGYVPTEISNRIVKSGYFLKLIPRLQEIYIDDKESISIYFQILGPKGEKYIYNPPKAEGGGHYTEYIDRAKQLKHEANHSEAEILLLKLIDDVERESKRMGWGVAPGYYEQLAIIYRKEKMYDMEVKLLERYFEQILAPGAMQEKLSKRLLKAKQLRDLKG